MRIMHQPYRDGDDLNQIGRLIRRAHAQAPNASLVYDPDLREIVEPMLAWAEARYTRNGGDGKPLSIEALASNAFLEELMRSRDSVKPEAHYIHRQKLIKGDRAEPVTLPDSFYVKSIKPLEELRAFHKAAGGGKGREDARRFQPPKVVLIY